MYSDDGRNAKVCYPGQYPNEESDDGVPAVGSDSCVTCPSRWVCSSGRNRSRCSSGLYPAGGDGVGAGASRCDACPAGTRCPLHTDLPEPCPDGQYSGVGQASCSECVSGEFLEFVTSNASGTFRRCVTCSGGEVCADNKTVSGCGQGQVPDKVQGATRCVDVGVGFYSDDGRLAKSCIAAAIAWLKRHRRSR